MFAAFWQKLPAKQGREVSLRSHGKAPDRRGVGQTLTWRDALAISKR